MSSPRILPLNPPNRAEAVREAAAALRRGALVIMPTDTVYGVAAAADLPGAEERLYNAKSRDRGKPIPLLAAGLAEVEAFGARLGARERAVAARYWPGPLTLVLPVGGRTEGFRVPAHEAALDLLRACRGVLRVTSANASGEPPALTAAEAVRALGASVEVALDDGPSPGGLASTVARIEAAGTVTVLREGPISAAELEETCRRAP